MFKKTVITIALAIVILSAPQLIKAATSNNPNFPTFEEVQQMISQSLSNLQSQIDNLVNNQTQSDQKAADLENSIQSLSSKINSLEFSTATMTARIDNLNQKILGQKRVFGVSQVRGSLWSTSDTSPSVKTPDEVSINCPVNCLLWVNYDVDTRNTVGGFQHIYHIFIDDTNPAVFNQATMTTASAAVPLAVNGVFPVSAGQHTVSIYVRLYGGTLEQHESHLQVMAIEP